MKKSGKNPWDRKVKFGFARGIIAVMRLLCCLLAVITTSGRCYECYEVLRGVMRCHGRVGITAITAMEEL